MSEKENRESGKNKASRKILIVDDESDLVTLIANKFTRNGWVVTCASNLATAIHQIRTIQFEAALVDVRLADASGFLVIENGRGSKLNAEIKFFAMSGIAADRETVLTARNLNVLRFFVKPFDIASVVAELGRLVE